MRGFTRSNFFAAIISPAPRSYDQPALALGEGDLRLGPGIEFETVGFDAVAEDDAVLRHQRADAQACRFRQPAVDQARLRGAAWKRFAYRELQFVAVPGQRRIGCGIDFATERAGRDEKFFWNK